MVMSSPRSLTSAQWVAVVSPVRHRTWPSTLLAIRLIGYLVLSSPYAEGFTTIAGIGFGSAQKLVGSSVSAPASLAGNALSYIAPIECHTSASVLALQISL